MCNSWIFCQWPSWFSSRASRPMGLLFSVFQNFAFLIFYDFFFICINMDGTIWEKKFQTTSPLILHNRFTPKNSCILLGGSLSTLYKDWSNFKFGFFFFANFSFILINMGPHGRKKFKRHLVWKYTTDLLPKIQAYSRKGLHQSCIKNCESLEFWKFFSSVLGD